ncbi:DUF397 domain-containing protein [Kitasatospora sp. NPDC059646]|uniref:DUF397 domain-containing protein n=1 Tax=Kitasatospora sp. NPDC059646 TaxID=3346893 RepID=UPI0036B2F75D
MEHDVDLSAAGWFKSSFSGNGGQCVEITTDFVASHDALFVRDSKDPHGPALSVTPGAWAAFAAAAAAGEFGEV